MEEINLMNLMNYLKNKVVVISLIGMVFAIVAFIYTINFKEELYSATTTLVLTTDSSSSDSITQSDLEINSKLLSTYTEIIKSKKVLNRVIDELDLVYDYEELVEMINVSNKTNTDIINISIESPIANETGLIVNEIAEVFIDEIVLIYNIENTSIIDFGEVSDEPCNINIPLQTLIGFCIGLLISFGMYLSFYYFDKSVRSIEEIESILEYPVLSLVHRKRR